MIDFPTVELIVMQRAYDFKHFKKVFFKFWKFYLISVLNSIL